jgi:hypothetical protein
MLFCLCEITTVLNFYFFTTFWPLHGVQRFWKQQQIIIFECFADSKVKLWADAIRKWKLIFWFPNVTLVERSFGPNFKMKTFVTKSFLSVIVISIVVYAFFVFFPSTSSVLPRSLSQQLFGERCTPEWILKNTTRLKH